LIKVDGSQGEGGGQVLRSSLALSILTGKIFRIDGIRANRSKPGLRPQHIAAVKAAAKISWAEVEGAESDSKSLTFVPDRIKSGKYKFDIGTAGSTALVFQTIFVPLSHGKGSSTITLTGGTHVPFSPCYHYLENQWLPYVIKSGFSAAAELELAGYFPEGGGKVKVIIRPAKSISPLNLTERGQLEAIQGISAVSNLDDSIAKRQKLQALRRIQTRFREVKIKNLLLPSPGKGTFLMLLAQFENSRCCFFSLGKPGKRAERVADEVVNELEAFMDTDGAIDPYLADQLLLPLAFASGVSQLRTSKVTHHLLTNAAIIEQFTNSQIRIDGREGEPGLVEIKPSPQEFNPA
jgi:RNA 3'-phosphate cyclase